MLERIKRPCCVTKQTPTQTHPTNEETTMNTNGELITRVLNNPKYQELLQRRNRISLSFFAVTLIIYAGFILTLAFDPELFARPVGDLTMSIGVLTATLVLISACILVALYVYISNKIFDPLLNAVIQEVEQ